MEISTLAVFECTAIIIFLLSFVIVVVFAARSRLNHLTNYFERFISMFVIFFTRNTLQLCNNKCLAITVFSACTRTKIYI
jgi:hypothetical protein